MDLPYCQNQSWATIVSGLLKVLKVPRSRNSWRHRPEEQDPSSLNLKLRKSNFQLTMTNTNIFISYLDQKYATDDILGEHFGQRSLLIYIILLYLAKINKVICTEYKSFWKPNVMLTWKYRSTNIIIFLDRQNPYLISFPAAKSLKALRFFLGLSGYCRQFVSDCAILAKALTSLLK